MLEEIRIDEDESYRANHFRALLAPGDILSLGERFNGARVEVQVATLMMHAWSEVEHDLLYKKLDGEPSDEEKDLLKELNQVVRCGDHLIEKLAEARDRRIRGDRHMFVSVSELYDQLRTAQTLEAEPPQWLRSFSEGVFRHLQDCGRANQMDVEEALTGASKGIDEQELADLLFAGSLARSGWQDDEQAKQRVIPRGQTWWQDADGEWVSIYDTLMDLNRRYEQHVADNPDSRDMPLERGFTDFRHHHLSDSINRQVSYEYQDRIHLLEHQARHVLGDVQ
ncbi:hypothetical protein ACTQ49_14890 [Luteococcus sp. Sow4_B9]|uniref:hypothetical protein n=1 Tax=Luteococcus sp. Sow4_B9 TaxID=3438792 RepID=UPI003F9CC3F8